jgi:PmbA protein
MEVLNMFVYADNAATTAMSQVAIDAMLPHFNKIYGNPSSLHSVGQAAKEAMDAARATVAGPMTVAPSNFHFLSSDRSRDDLYLDAGNALLVTDLMGMHSGANAVSGDFSLGAKGFLIKNGKVDRPVNQITIAGNFFELLRDIEAVGSDLEFGASCFASPTLMVRSLSVAGK